MNSMAHSMFGPKCSLGESPDKCSPGGLLAVTGWTRRVSATHMTMNLEVTTAPTDVKARLRAAVRMGKLTLLIKRDPLYQACQAC